MEPELDQGERIVGRVFIWRILDPDGFIRDDVICDDGDDGDLDRHTALGMCTVGEHTIWAYDFGNVAEE